MPTTNKNEGYGTATSLKLSPNNCCAVGVPGKKFDDVGNGYSNKGHPTTNHVQHRRHTINTDAYFTEFTFRKALLYGIASLYVVSCGVVSVAERFMTLPCDTTEEAIKFPNPAFNGSHCLHTRQPLLLGLTPMECSFGRRLVLSILMGGLIGWERRQADRPAGIRTMSLVSLGSCLFTINSAFAFVGGPMDWDASRISAAIPSGVGFLGAGLIFKKTQSEGDNMVVHGLTTAASVWLSAAVGIACGGELYFAASFGTCLMMLLLRFGPRGSDHDDDDEYLDDDVSDHDEEEDPEFGTNENTMLFRDSEGREILPPGLQLTTRSVHDGKGSVDGGSFTVTGESLENNSLAAIETTPMLPISPSAVQTPKHSHSQSQLSRSGRSNNRNTSKNPRIRKRTQSKANLGSIV